VEEQHAASEARELLTNLAVQLQAVSLTNQQLVAVNQQRIQSDHALASYLSHLTRALSEASRRMDTLEERLETVSDDISRLYSNLSAANATGYTQSPYPAKPPVRGQRGFRFSPGQILGGGVGYAVDQYFNQAGGGKRRPR